jgi:Mn-dependent DtxR family transcriptional regulator
MRTMVEVRLPHTAGELANSLGIDKGYVSNVLHALADDRLIERTPRGSVTDVAWEALIRRIVSSYSMFESNETRRGLRRAGPPNSSKTSPARTLVVGR